MIDQYKRNINYMRISITDRCNLRCAYCMPAEGIESIPHQDILTYDELIYIVQTGVSLGIRHIKVTGGEPFVRKDVMHLLHGLKAIPGLESVTISSNGLLIGPYISELAKIGIDGINISLDTMNPTRFHKLTGSDCVQTVIDNIYTIARETTIPVKVNCVPLYLDSIRTSMQDRMDIIEFAKHDNIHVRFIEMMPIGCGKKFTLVSEDEIRSEIEDHYGTLTPCFKSLGNGPSSYYSVPGLQGNIGFISAVSHKFCNSCNRIRLSSQGYLQTCLQYDQGYQLRPYLRSGDPSQLIEIMRDAIYGKPKEHQFARSNNEDKADVSAANTCTKTMSSIGG